MTYIGQAQIETQIEHDDYAVGDIVVWESAQQGAKYLVEGFDGDRAILRPLHEHTWTPMRRWFVKEGS